MNTKELDLSAVGPICYDCAELLDFAPKDKMAGAWYDECGVCHQHKPCTDLHHDWKYARKGESNENRRYA